ncbi:MAG: AmmeMemoRadiSam system radical SAM enzyme [Promethearchaeota archaeon]
MKEAVLYEKLKKNMVRCNVCARRCIITEGNRGNCGIRKNIGGKLYNLVYGSMISKGSIDPIEKKPLYNFWPGYNIYSVATVGCNFHCKMCQNWDISQCYPNDEGTQAICEDVGSGFRFRPQSYPLTRMTPEELVQRVKKSGTELIAYTYNEPTIWHEYIIDVAKLAKEEGIKNVLVTNGYSTPEASEQLVKYMDAANIDFKAFTDDFYKRIVGVPSMKPVLDTSIYWKTHGMHIEITNLIIPEENDNPDEIREMTRWINKNLGADTPIHFSAYHPDYKLRDKPRTSPEILLTAYNIAKEEGLHHVYIGNVYTSKGNNTYCPECGELLIERAGYTIKKLNLGPNNTCPKCGADTEIKGKARTRSSFFF